MNRPPLRVLIALAVTLFAVVVLAVVSFRGDGGDADSTTTTTVAGTTTASTNPAEISTTTTSIEVLPDWYPKQSSRYSDRRPAVTVTTLPPTTTEDPSDSDSDSDD